jgi:hypothetical protein
MWAAPKAERSPAGACSPARLRTEGAARGAFSSEGGNMTEQEHESGEEQVEERQAEGEEREGWEETNDEPEQGQDTV